MRVDKRKPDQLRPIKITRDFVSSALSSVLFEMGNTKILCTASVDYRVPDWMANSGRGWMTAEYAMIPGATGQRKPRTNRLGRADGRTYEIQRLVGRVLRAVVDMELLGEKTIWLDCEVLQADGGTRCAAINAAWLALSDAVQKLLAEQSILKNPIKSQVAAVSVGKVKGQILLDLDYPEDSRAEVDFNVALTGEGEFVEIQGTAESKPFTEQELAELIKLARKGISEIIEIQKKQST
ncbi:MAG: ribonuclease PH [Planctomycetes bacterium]|nr:ribonuclease PH [Planctomycetota bacterium]